MKIVRLDIEEDSFLAGIDAMSLVEAPAIQEDFYYFAAETYNDYPEAAVEAAKQGIKRNEESGNKCATQVGKVRAQQLANREAVSLETVRRMRAFLIRQKDNYELARDRKDYTACGYISYLLWGGPSALAWAEKKLRQAGEEFVNEEYADLEDACQTGYIAYGLKRKRGRLVPNCVPKEGYDYPPEVELILLDEKIEGLVTKADKSGISYGILKKVYDRGMAAWKTGHRPGTTPQQWAFARVNSFITGGKTRTTGDADLWKQAKGQKEEAEDSREIGTDAQRKERQKMTPFQPVLSFKEHSHCGTEDCCQECKTASLIESNVYRVGSEKYYEYFQEKRVEYRAGEFNPTGFNKDLMEGDIGKYAIYEGENVPLDCPMMESEYQGKDVDLNKPKSGGSKKYYVYVKDPSSGNIKKVSWGDTSGLKVKLNDPEARKSFAARHDCANKKDKTKAGYWACNLPRYAKQLGLSGGGNFFW